ncbi:hypothetical protein [Fodinibius salsisoli]|uniref:Uncharacterized protein n=1 Tax=Fodinibius salsisoli TaxID=2820877 RepID=A0ABT3PTF4_9BACT|nr:hypothetical protein [Fodinibius salsisoli]MCW9709149.1 hypothetical protein [Fodinibius salsisoli]
MMNQTVQQTTQKLIDLLPENEEHYRVDELRSWGIPPFIVRRIQVELERNLAESMVLPTTDWANLQSVAVQNAWDQFVQAIRDEARLPASYAKAVFETAVTDVLDMMTEPRKNIPDVIFGSNDELDYETLQKRAKAVVVYQHFATLLQRYMQKKQLEVLSRERCEKIIRKADERLAANYSPLNWAQMLDPLFNLLDDQIDPTLLRLFFEDKGRDQIADIFDRRDDKLDRAEFIEILSAPDFTNTESAVLEDSDPAGEEPEKEEAPEAETPPQLDEVQEVPTSVEPAEEQPPVEKEFEFKEKQQEDKTGEDVEDDSEDLSLNTNFSEWETIQETPANGSDENDDSISALFSDPEEQEGLGTLEGADESQAEADEQQEIESDDQEEESEPLAKPEEEEDPIWMRFMSEEEKTVLAEEESAEDSPISFGEQLTEDNANDFDKQEEEPIIDSTEHKDEDLGKEKEVERLEKQLADRHDHFVEAIFDGSEQAYEEALQNIVSFENWRQASKYIQKQVFSRNMVDLYSEPAVAFTDRLQNYFLAKENK